MDKETDSHGKAFAVPVAVVAGLGMVGMGVLSDGVARAADITTVTDTLSITVEGTCTFRNTEDATYIGSAMNGSEVGNFNDSGIHTFYLFCNDNGGYTVSATPHDLTANGIEDVISYTDNYTHTGADGMWTAEIATNGEAGVTVISPVPTTGGVILRSDTASSSSMSFTATYSAYVGTKTPAGTYGGTIEYTLSSLSGTPGGSSENGSGDNSGSGSGGNGQNDDNGENGDNSGADSGNDSGNGGSGTNNGNSGTGTEEPDNTNPDTSSNTPSNTQNVTPQNLNNTYNTYNTYGATNTYNTTNYSGGGMSTPVAANTLGATSVSNKNDDDDTTDSNSSKNSAGTSSSYEKPLGVVTTTTKSSDEGSGTDLTPIAVAGVALAVAGVAAVAIAKNKKEE